MPRPRKYATNAERHRAHRARKALKTQQLEELVKKYESLLRDSGAAEIFDCSLAAAPSGKDILDGISRQETVLQTRRER
jgi:hypothetical protein